MGRTMEWAARSDHLGGIPRKLIITAVGAFAKTVTSLLNSTTVHNSETLVRLVRSRPPGTPLITVSNHMSTLDDPLMWGFKGFPVTDAKLVRWVLAAEDICFKNAIFSYFFRLGKCIPITRGGGVYQEHMSEALDLLNDGAWALRPHTIVDVVDEVVAAASAVATVALELHTFPEGKVSQVDKPVRQLKWGTASLIDRSRVTPIVLPIVHRGFDKVMPEKFFFDRRPPIPLWGKKISIIIGEPIELNLPKLRQTAKAMPRGPLSQVLGWPPTSPHGLDEAAQRWLYTTISDKIQSEILSGSEAGGEKSREDSRGGAGREQFSSLPYLA
ncbi:hypothetical protein Sjap_017652 [Stephania japonica]|uniref:Tafazzin family protein n=1 Tax=Stephania japonica TaxID=461633 RepID=A0AAP0I6J5_9MAGN